MKLFSVLNPNFHLTGKPAQYVTMTRDDIRQLPAFQECEEHGSFGLTIDRMRDIGWRIYELATEDKTINDALNRHVKLMRIIVSEDHEWYRFGDTLRVATNFGSDRYFDLWFPVVGTGEEIIDRLVDSVMGVLMRHGITSDEDMEFAYPPHIPEKAFSLTVAYNVED